MPISTKAKITETQHDSTNNSHDAYVRQSTIKTDKPLPELSSSSTIPMSMSRTNSQIIRRLPSKPASQTMRPTKLSGVASKIQTPSHEIDSVSSERRNPPEVRHSNAIAFAHQRGSSRGITAASAKQLATSLKESTPATVPIIPSNSLPRQIQSKKDISSKQPLSIFSSENSLSLLPDSARLRDEILQLRQVHANSQKTLHKFQMNVQDGKISCFRNLAEYQTETINLEREFQYAASSLALQSWLANSPMSDDHQIQTLSKLIYDLYMCASEMETSESMQQFRQWLEANSRGQSEMTGSCSVPEKLSQIQPLDSQWEFTMARLQLKLLAVAESLHELLTESDSAVLLAVINQHHKLAHIFLQQVGMALFLKQKLTQIKEQRRIVQVKHALEQARHNNPEAHVRTWSRS